MFKIVINSCQNLCLLLCCVTLVNIVFDVGTYMVCICIRTNFVDFKEFCGVIICMQNSSEIDQVCVLSPVLRLCD